MREMKPHIRLNRGPAKGYLCYVKRTFDGVIGYGATPEQAYKNWYFYHACSKAAR